MDSFKWKGIFYRLQHLQALVKQPHPTFALHLQSYGILPTSLLMGKLLNSFRDLITTIIK